jgi:predicted ATPase
MTSTGGGTSEAGSTVLVGENGSGKSSLVEAIAAAWCRSGPAWRCATSTRRRRHRLHVLLATHSSTG